MIKFNIIGLLVAGITGGASLVESARIRSLINELNSYKQAVHSFYVVKGRYPGDLNVDNYTGRCDTGVGCIHETYTSSSFPAPYDGSDEDYGIPNFVSAPFVDLYLEKIIDFKPKKVNSSVNSAILVENGGIPYSKVFPKGRTVFYSYGDVSSAASTSFYYNMKNASPYINISNSSTYKQTKLFKTIDQKVDDGLYNSGSFRANGISDASGSYDTAITNKVISIDLYYNIGIK